MPAGPGYKQERLARPEAAWRGAEGEPLRLADTHCHLTHGRLRGQLAGVLASAAQAGVAALITAASNVPDAQAAAALAERHARVYCTAGIHPHDAAGADPDHLLLIAEVAGRAKNVAIGEIGLDYHYDFSPRPDQRRVFAGQLDLAARLGKPVVIHTREAFEDTMAILADARLPGERIVFHSFTGDDAQVRRVLEIGACVSFSGIATFHTADDIRRAAAIVPDDRILIETDSPFLSPEPVRKSKINTPANVVHVCRCLAAVRGVAPDALAAATTANAVRVFGLNVQEEETANHKEHKEHQE